jgi:hypothetical protein
VKVSKAIRKDAQYIRGILQTIRNRDNPRWMQGDARTMELLLARAIGARPLAGGASGDMVLLGTVKLPDAGPVRYIIDAKLDPSGKGQSETKHSGLRSKLTDLIGVKERVIHATLWVNANGQVEKAGLFRFYEGFRTVSWRAMEPLTEVSDMNDLAKPATLAVFREEVLARLRRTDLKSYSQHVVEVARRFAEVAVADVVLGYKAVAKETGAEGAEGDRRWAANEILEAEDSEEGATKLLGAKAPEEAATKLLRATDAEEAATKLLGATNPEEAAAKLLGLSVEELRQRLRGGQ